MLHHALAPEVSYRYNIGNVCKLTAICIVISHHFDRSMSDKHCYHKRNVRLSNLKGQSKRYLAKLNRNETLLHLLDHPSKGPAILLDPAENYRFKGHTTAVNYNTSI